MRRLIKGIMLEFIMPHLDQPAKIIKSTGNSLEMLHIFHIQVLYGNEWKHFICRELINVNIRVFWSFYFLSN